MKGDGGTYANHRTAELPSALRVTSIASSIARGRRVTEPAPMSARIVNRPPVLFAFTANDSVRDETSRQDGVRRTGPNKTEPQRAERGADELAG